MPAPAKPLQGKRIVVTRAAQQAGPLLSQLRALGAEPVSWPVIDFASPLDWGPLDRAIARLASYDWLVFTSVNGVAYFWQRLAHAGQDAAALGAVRTAAIGPATARALQQRGVMAAQVPETYVAEALAAALHDVAGQRILLARAAVARPALPAMLRARGAHVDEVAAYRTVPVAHAERAALLERPVDVITFTSPSTVHHFVEQVGAAGMAALAGATIACIGPVTAEAARACGLTPDVTAAEYTVPGLVAALVRYVQRRDAP